MTPADEIKNMTLKLLMHFAGEGRFLGSALIPEKDTGYVKGLSNTSLLHARHLLHVWRISPWLREETLAVLRHAPALFELIDARFNRGRLLEVAGLLHLQAAIAVLRALLEDIPHTEEWDDALLELELHAEDASCLKEGCVGAWVRADALKSVAPTRPHRDVVYEPDEATALWRALVRNRMRWLRLEGDIRDRWAAEATIGRALAPAHGRLVWSVAPPGVVSRLAEIGGADVEVDAEALRGARGARARRRKELEAVRSLLARRGRVACAGNHSTPAARRALIACARRMGALSLAVFYAPEPYALLEANEAKGFPVPQRILRRVLGTLQAPRPHEAELVFVVGDEGGEALWHLGEGVHEGFVEREWGSERPVGARVR